MAFDRNECFLADAMPLSLHYQCANLRDIDMPVGLVWRVLYMKGTANRPAPEVTLKSSLLVFVLGLQSLLVSKGWDSIIEIVMKCNWT